MKTDVEEIKKIIRALLLSTKNGLTVNELCSEYSAITGQTLPYKDLGYFAAVDLVKDMPDVVRPMFLSGGVMLLKGIADSTTAHINELVRGQKSTRYTSRIVHCNTKKPVELVLPSYIRNKISILMRNYPKGIELLTFERAYQSFFGRKIDCRSFGFNDLKSVLLKCNDILTVRKVSDKLTFVYPVNLNGKKPLLPTPKQGSFSTANGIPQLTKLEIYSLLSKFKLGLWSSRFISEYQSCFKKSFKLHELGFNSIIELMSKLPEIVRIERPNAVGDWILQPVLSEEKLSIIATECCIPKDTKFLNGQEIKVYISYIVTPSSFWFQQVGTECELDNLMEKINMFYNSAKGDIYNTPDLRVGQICCALYEEDKQWYRAVVKSIVSKEKVQVHYVDYGNETVVNKSSVRLLLQEFNILSFQAHQGKLNISPNDDLWTDAAVKYFFNLTQDQNLYARVSEVNPRNVNLDVFLNQNRSENIAQLLENAGHGNCVIRTDSEKVENLKNYYQKYYQALKQVSALSTVQLTKPATQVTEDSKVIIEEQETIKPFKSITINEDTIITIVNHNNEPLVSSAEISSLFWNADILRQMSRQKGISLTREVVNSEESPQTLEILNKYNVKGIITCGNHKSIIMYHLNEILPLFGVFNTNYENSEMLIKTEIKLWNQLGEKYWDTEYNKPTPSESNDLKLQALKFKKKRLYMSMITNSANSNAMDEILSIEKEINLLSLS